MTNKQYRCDITKKELETIIEYNPDTGTLVWIGSHGRPGKHPAGRIAGWKNMYGYIEVRIHGVIYRAHHLAWLLMTGEFPKIGIDHKNHIRNDNKWRNLRAADQQTNSRNCKMNKRNTTGQMGVYWHKRRNKWYVGICVDGKNKHGGCFTDFFEAVCRRKSLEVEHNFHPNHGGAA